MDRVQDRVVGLFDGAWNFPVPNCDLSLCGNATLGMALVSRGVEAAGGVALAGRRSGCRRRAGHAVFCADRRDGDLRGAARHRGGAADDAATALAGCDALLAIE